MTLLLLLVTSGYVGLHLLKNLKLEKDELKLELINFQKVTGALAVGQDVLIDKLKIFRFCVIFFLLYLMRTYEKIRM